MNVMRGMKDINEPNVLSRHKRNTLSAMNTSLDKSNSRLGTIEEKVIALEEEALQLPKNRGHK